MDRLRDGIQALNGTVDLHLHSTASDGRTAPAAVVERAAAAGLTAIALTDHDTLAGVAEAEAAGERTGVRVIGGCEFSVAAPWGEMHVLGYFLPAHANGIETFLADRRDDRHRRAVEMVTRLQSLGVGVTVDDVAREAAGGAVGRPHVARAIVRHGAAVDIGQAFDRYLGRGRPAFVDKTLPAFGEVAELVHRHGGVVSAAHLKDRGTRTVLQRLQAEGLDAIETRHPSHDPDTRERLTTLALALGLLRTGGSDWHGEEPGGGHGQPGSQDVPLEWLQRLEQARRS